MFAESKILDFRKQQALKRNSCPGV